MDLSEIKLTNSEMVAQFMTIFGQEIPKKQGFPSPEVIELRMKLIDEEVKEFKESVADGDFSNAMKELSDILYVVYGAALAMGVNLDPVFREVHDSNLSKLGPNGEVLRRADGKVQKGPNYRTADVESVLSAMAGY